MTRPAMKLTFSPRQTEIEKVHQRLRFGNLVRVYIEMKCCISDMPGVVPVS